MAARRCAVGLKERLACLDDLRQMSPEEVASLFRPSLTVLRCAHVPQPTTGTTERRQESAPSSSGYANASSRRDRRPLSHFVQA